MKKILLAIFLVLVLSVGAVGLYRLSERNRIADRYNALCGRYHNNITLYANAASDKLDYEGLAERGICPLLALLENPAADVYVGFVPMNPRREEVLIFYTQPELPDDGLNILALACFRKETGDTPFLIVAGERDRFVLCRDGNSYALAEYASNSAAQSAVFFWKLNETGRLEMTDGVLYDFDVDEHNPCFIVKDTNFNTAAGTPCSEEDADNIIAKYKPIPTLDTPAFPLRHFMTSHARQH